MSRKNESKKMKTDLSNRQIVDVVLSTVTPQRKFFFITYGPSGSGKSAIIHKAMKRFGVDPDTLVKVDVDSILEYMPGFTTAKETIASTQGLSDTMRASKIQELYWSTRKERGGDDLSDMLLDAALLQNYNIAWETTGANVAWTVKEIKRITKLGYTICILYPIVPTTLLVKRVRERQRKTAQVAADQDQIKKDVIKAADNVKRLLPYIDQLLVYDNSGNAGEEKVVLEMSNTYLHTSEHNQPGPGWQQVWMCECENLDLLKKKFDKTIVELFNHCECMVSDASKK